MPPVHIHMLRSRHKNNVLAEIAQTNEIAMPTTMFPKLNAPRKNMNNDEISRLTTKKRSAVAARI